MAVKPVLKMGHKILWQRAAEVDDPCDETIKLLIQDMVDTMIACDGVGLAAPQIGVSKRIVIFGVEKSERYPDADPVPQTILINPIVLPIDDSVEEGWEGCLSVPGMRGWVPRYKTIQYSGYDEKGNEISRTVEGFHARVVQHEVDHLDGMLYPNRVVDKAKFGFEQDSFPEK